MGKIRLYLKQKIHIYTDITKRELREIIGLLVDSTNLGNNNLLSLKNTIELADKLKDFQAKI